MKCIIVETGQVGFLAVYNYQLPYGRCSVPANEEEWQSSFSTMKKQSRSLTNEVVLQDLVIHDEENAPGSGEEGLYICSKDKITPS